MTILPFSQAAHILLELIMKHFFFFYTLSHPIKSVLSFSSPWFLIKVSPSSFWLIFLINFTDAKKPTTCSYLQANYLPPMENKWTFQVSVNNLAWTENSTLLPHSHRGWAQWLNLSSTVQHKCCDGSMKKALELLSAVFLILALKSYIIDYAA